MVPLRNRIATKAIAHLEPQSMTWIRLVDPHRKRPSDMLSKCRMSRKKTCAKWNADFGRNRVTLNLMFTGD